MPYDRFIRTGAFGALITAICCFTPVLSGALAAAGMAALVGWLDIVLLPLLGVFLAMLFFGLAGRARMKKASGTQAPDADSSADT